MPNRELSKLRILHLAQIFESETDEQHALTLAELSERLDRLGVGAERKALYRDLETLREFGMDLIAEKSGGTTRYFLGARTFELAELKLLTDAVQGAKFITEAKSRALMNRFGRAPAGTLSGSGDRKSAAGSKQPGPFFA